MSESKTQPKSKKTPPDVVIGNMSPEDAARFIVSNAVAVRDAGHDFVRVSLARGKGGDVGTVVFIDGYVPNADGLIILSDV